MKSLSIFIVSLLSYSLHAQITELNQGSCWIEQGDSHLKYVDFSTQTQAVLPEDIHYQFADAHGEKIIEAYFECFSGGNRFLLTTLGPEGQEFCVWATLNEEHMEVLERFPLVPDHKGPCLGYQANKRIIGVKDAQALEDYIKAHNYSSIFTLEWLGPKTAIAYALEEEKFHILESLELVEYVELDINSKIVGETYLLK